MDRPWLTALDERVQSYRAVLEEEPGAKRWRGAHEAFPEAEGGAGAASSSSGAGAPGASATAGASRPAQGFEGLTDR